MLRHVKTMLLAAALAAGSSQAWAQSIRPDPDENLQWAAAVVRIDALRNQGDATVKLFGTAGGDPAMNGLYTYLAFFESPGDGWRVFRLGDFLTYRILSEARGRVVLEIRDSGMNERTGDIGTRIRRLLVSWTAGAGGAPPASVRVTSAR
ncbi:MAG: hypothetical protein QOH47_468 [Sphingomonadales bacterium]|jgi:hypothetical protein|nr:hypothetical protein [Sphingomonadales bacterium]